MSRAILVFPSTPIMAGQEQHNLLNQPCLENQSVRIKVILSIKLRHIFIVHKVETYFTDTVIPPSVTINTKKNTPKTVRVRVATGQGYKFTNYVYERRLLQPSMPKRNAA